MFYCHGGGYASGSAGACGQDGAHLAAEYDVVVAALDIAPKDLHKLADVPADRILAIQTAGAKGSLATRAPAWAASHPDAALRITGEHPDVAGNHGPVVDGRVLPAHPFDPVSTPLAAGIPPDDRRQPREATFFNMGIPSFFKMDEAEAVALLRQAVGDRADAVLAADRKSAQPSPVYRYRYDSPRISRFRAPAGLCVPAVPPRST